MCYENTAGQHGYGMALSLQAWDEHGLVNCGSSFASSTVWLVSCIRAGIYWIPNLRNIEAVSKALILILPLKETNISWSTLS